VVVISQDSSDPTGIKAPERKQNSPNPASRARNRKADAALSLAIGGVGWNDIASALGYPTGRTARVAAEKALQRQLDTPEDRAQLRKMADLRIIRLLQGAWPKAINPDHPEHLAALAKCRDLIGDYRKLYGLDAPSEVVVHTPDAAEIEAFVARLVNPVPVQEFDIIDGEVVEEEPRALPAE
jgi:hypothetical protein